MRTIATNAGRITNLADLYEEITAATTALPTADIVAKLDQARASLAAYGATWTAKHGDPSVDDDDEVDE